MKLTADRDGNMRRFSAKLGFKEQFDPKEIQILYTDAVPALIPPVSVQGRRNNLIQYDISSYSTLEFYLSCILSREQFADLLLRCLETFQRMQQIYLNYKNLVFDLDKIYVQLSDRSIHFIYLPLMNSKREGALPDFFRLLIAKAARSTHEQSSFLDACLIWLDRPAAFTLGEFEAFVQSHVCAHADASVQKHDCDFTNAEPVAPAPQARFVAPTPKAEWPQSQAESLLGNTCQLNESVGGTVLLGESAPPAPKVRFYIQRLQTDELIELTHFPFLVGTEIGSAAYCVSGNAAVSRRHAEFSLQDGICMIADQKSTNKTYVNQQMLVPFTPQALEDGVEIRLGNERFKFMQKELP